MEKFTADEFRQQPAIVYRKIDLQGAVEIVHSRYPDLKIIITGLHKETKDDE